MKRELPAILASCLATLWVAGCASNHPKAAVSDATPSTSSPTHDEWVDPDTGHRVVRLSRVSGESESFYFHQNAFTESGDKMVFANTGTDHSRNLFVLDWKSRSIQPLTDGGTNRGEVVAPRGRRIYYTRDSVIYSTHLDTRITKRVAELPAGWRGLTVNADETLLAGAYGEGAAEIARGQPRSYWFKAIHDAKLPHLLFTVEIATGKLQVILRGNDWFNHVQFSPTDPGLLMFCHEGPWQLVDRIWQVRTDGSGLKLVHQRSVTNEIAGHEFWAPDGKRAWFDLQVPRSQTFFIAGADESTGTETRYPLERDQWSVHFNISRDGSMFAGDGGASNMVAHAQNGKWIWLFLPQPDGTVRAQKLCNMGRHDYSLEPNVNFTPDGKWIVFRSNMDGTSQVYAVEVAALAAHADSGRGADTNARKLLN
jgi:oligogalacturonide lyase